jgi:hypothetical protein
MQIKNDIELFRNKIAKLEKQQGGGSTSSTLEKVVGADPNTILLLHMSGADGASGSLGYSGVFIDSSFNSYPVRNYYLTIPPLVSITSSQSKFGNTSAKFNGENYLSITYVDEPQELKNFDFGYSDFTIEAFVRLDIIPTSDTWPVNFQSTMMVFTKGSPSSADGYGFLIGQTQLMFEVADTVIINGTHGMVIDTWYHIAVCRNGASVKLFVDGNEIASQVVSPINNLTGGTSVWIGTETNQGAYLRGYLDELRVSNVARYTGSFSAPTQQFSADGTFPANKTGKIAYNDYCLYVCTDETSGKWKRVVLQDF